MYCILCCDKKTTLILVSSNQVSEIDVFISLYYPPLYCKFAAYFQNYFLSEYLWWAASVLIKNE